LPEVPARLKPAAMAEVYAREAVKVILEQKEDKTFLVEFKFGCVYQ
jgi:hypothetical protein